MWKELFDVVCEQSENFPPWCQQSYHGLGLEPAEFNTKPALQTGGMESEQDNHLQDLQGLTVRLC